MTVKLRIKVLLKEHEILIQTLKFEKKKFKSLATIQILK